MTARETPPRAGTGSRREAGAEARDGRAPLRVLIVEDQEDDVLLLLRALKRGGYEPSYERVETAGAMEVALEKGDWDVVVSDHAMPSFSAPAALELLHEGGWPDLPFIIVSGHIGEDAAVAVMKAGAHDYVPKDGLARLAPAIERELRDAEERRQRRQAQEALREAEEKYRSIFENAVEGIYQTTTEGRLMTANPMLARMFGYESPEEMVETISDVTELYVEPARRAELDRRMRRDGRVFEFEIQMRRKDGALIWVSTNARAVRDASGEVVGHEGTIEDITERKRAEEDLRRSLGRLVALHEAGQVLGSTLEPEEIGERLLDIMCRTSGLAAAAISLPENGRARIWRSVGMDDLTPELRRAPEARAAREAALEEEATRIFDVPRETALPGVSVGLCLPLRVREKAVGVLEVYGPGTLAEEDTVALLESLTNQAASALDNARLYGELQEREQRLQDLVGRILTAQEEERRRVAYDVHDGLAQVAAAAHQHLQVFAQLHPPTSTEAREDLSRAAELVRRTVGEARQVIADLRPTALDDFGLASAIRLQLDALRDAGWFVRYDDSLGDERLPAAAETAVFRVAQEALSNVGKHAETQRVEVALERRESGRLRLQVRDYGRGFDPELLGGAGPGERVGMAGMRERITLLGGEFRVASRPGEGTLIVAEVPLPNREAPTEDE